MRRYINWILYHRLVVIGLTLLFTGFLALQMKGLKIIIDPNAMLPQLHPYVATTKKIEEIFGSKYVIVIGIMPKYGDVFQPEILAKVEHITTALLEVPGVIKENILSLSVGRAKNIIVTADGLEVRPLMAGLPQTLQQITALRQAVHNNPVYLNSIVSNDDRTTAIMVEFKEGPDGFRGIMGKVNSVVERERDASVDIAISGTPAFLARIENYSARMVFLFPLAILIVGLIHFEAFRSAQGLILPLVTALVAVVWGLGVMGLAGVPMDVFNVTTPILILAVAAGHAVQLLKRYYEEYHRIRKTTALSPQEANRAAVVQSIIRIGPVMITAGCVAAFGFFSLLVFDITTVRTFGVFTGIGILSALILEMTFTPALRSLLSAPREKEQHLESKLRVWGYITGSIANWTTAPRRWRIYVWVSLLLAVSMVGMTQVVINTSTKSYFAEDLPFRQEDRVLNNRLGGTNTLNVLIEGLREDAIKDPKILAAIESTQRFLEKQPNVGKTISLADFIKRMNQAMHGDNMTYYRIPESRNLISQYLLLYSMSGEPGDFDSYIDYGYKFANIMVFLRTDNTIYVQKLIDRLKAYAATQFGSDVRIKIGGTSPENTALTEVMVHGKILNIVQIGAVVFIISVLVFRSLAAGLLVIMPLLLAVIANFGLMGVAGISLNIPNSLTSAMVVGIGADYAIYLIYRLREELAAGATETTAIHNALNTAGKASLFVASAVAGGYSVLLFSFGFYIHIWMAILIGCAMLVSVFAALILIPALILSFRPRFIFNRKSIKLNPRPAAVSFLALMAGLSFTPQPIWAVEPTAVEIMEKNFVVSRVLDSTSDATFILVNKSGQERVRKTYNATKQQANSIDNMRMTRFLSPADVKGTVTLMIEHADKDDDIWIYLPALKKVRRLVSSNKKDSFVGTDFSYGDVIGQKVADWQHRMLREEIVEGKPCYVIESTPKNGSVKANSGYSKRVNWIRKDNYIAAKNEIWDASGQMLKTIMLADIKLVDSTRDKWQAMYFEAANLQTGHRTIIHIENFKVNQQVKDDVFTTRYMERDL